MTDTKLLVVADDLTGGLDTGVQFAKQGIAVRVIVDPGMQKEWTNTNAEVLVAVSETRHLSSEAAYQTVYRIVSAGKQAGIPFVYKKTDSALRGNVGAELSAAMDACEADVLSFLPAYPAMNRITINGCHYVDGVPVAQSVFGRDPFDPVTESDIRKLIGSQTETQVLYEQETGKGIFLADAKSDDDLKAAGEALAEKGYLSVSAGCAGFAAYLPELLGLSRGRAPQYPDFGEGLLVISGSLNPVTLRQLDTAEKNGFKRIRLRPEQRPEPEAATVPFIHDKWSIVDSSDGEQDRLFLREQVQRKEKTGEEVRIRVAADLAEIFAENAASCQGTVMIIGGDTLLACLKRLECRDLEPLAELFPGVVLSRYRTKEVEKLIISKSGGFGKESLLLDLRSQMEQRRKELSSKEANDENVTE